MNKEILHILVYFDEELNKIQWKSIVNFEDYELYDNDLFVFVREEIFFNRDNIEDFFEYYDIQNQEEIVDMELKNVFFTTTVINCNLFSYSFKDIKLKEEVEELYNFFIKDIEPISFKDYIEQNNK